MDQTTLDALQRIATALAGSHPQEAAQLQAWVRTGGAGTLPPTVLGLVIATAPTVGIPAATLMAGLRQVASNASSQTLPKLAGTVNSPVEGNVPENAGGPGTIGVAPAATTGGIQATGNPLEGVPAPAAGQQYANSPGAGAYATNPSGNSVPSLAEIAASNQRAAANPTPTNGGALMPPTSATGGGSAPVGGGNPGGFTSQQGDFLVRDDPGLIRFAMQAAGFNPDIVTPASKIALQQLTALMQSRRAAYGLSNPDQNVGGLPQDIASFAKEYTTPGANFYGNARQYAQGILGGQNFQDFMGGVSDQTDKFSQYASLIPLLYGGSNPMIQQSVSDQLKNIYSKWNLDSGMNPTAAGGKDDILGYIRNMPNLSPALRAIFGPQK
jgi:hypothetical protein